MLLFATTSVPFLGLTNYRIRMLSPSEQSTRNGKRNSQLNLVSRSTKGVLLLLFSLCADRHYLTFYCFFHGATATSAQGRQRYWGFTITFRHTTYFSTSLDEWSAWREDLFLKMHNIHKRQSSLPPAVFEPPIPASEKAQTDALNLRFNEPMITSLCTANNPLTPVSIIYW